MTSSSDQAVNVLSTAKAQLGQVTVGFANYPDGNGGLADLDFGANRALS